MTKQTLTLVKVGGNVVENEQELLNFLNQFIRVEGLKVLVHGGGKTATQIAEKLGVETQMVNGRRITNAEMIRVAAMVYAGLVNKNIVARLQALNCNALGLTGADLNTILSVKRPVKDIDYGFVGDVVKVDTSVLEKIIEMDTVPVFAPITHDKNGQLLNTNADTIAQSLAVALSNIFDVRLIFCFEKKGVLKDIDNPDSLIAQMNENQFVEFKNNGIIADGMVAKLENCFTAINQGVTNVLICKAEQIGNPTPEGTRLVK